MTRVGGIDDRILIFWLEDWQWLSTMRSSKAKKPSRLDSVLRLRSRHRPCTRWQAKKPLWIRREIKKSNSRPNRLEYTYLLSFHGSPALAESLRSLRQHLRARNKNDWSCSPPLFSSSQTTFLDSQSHVYSRQEESPFSSDIVISYMQSRVTLIYI